MAVRVHDCPNRLRQGAKAMVRRLGLNRLLSPPAHKLTLPYVDIVPIACPAIARGKESTVNLVDIGVCELS